MFGFGKKQGTPISKSPEFRTCDKCKHLVDSRFAQMVSFLDLTKEINLFFCPEHKVKWSRKENLGIHDMSTGRWSKQPVIRYFMDNVRCDEDGNIVKEEPHAD